MLGVKLSIIFVILFCSFSFSVMFAPEKNKIDSMNIHANKNPENCWPNNFSNDFTDNIFFRIFFPILLVILGIYIDRSIVRYQEKQSIKREIASSITNLIVKIKTNDFPIKGKKLSFSLTNHIPILDGIIICNKKYVSKSILKAYNNYKNPEIPNNFNCENSFEIYDIRDGFAKDYADFNYKNGKEFAIANLQQIIDAIK